MNDVVLCHGTSGRFAGCCQDAALPNAFTLWRPSLMQFTLATSTRAGHAVIAIGDHMRIGFDALSPSSHVYCEATIVAQQSGQCVARGPQQLRVLAAVQLQFA
jgi:hypothetical protein